MGTATSDEDDSDVAVDTEDDVEALRCSSVADVIRANAGNPVGGVGGVDAGDAAVAAIVPSRIWGLWSGVVGRRLTAAGCGKHGVSVVWRLALLQASDGGMCGVIDEVERYDGWLTARCSCLCVLGRAASAYGGGL